MKLLTLAAALLTAFGVAAPDRAEAQTACEYYRVKQGDTLDSIAAVAYGPAEFRRIWEANRAEIGGNPGDIDIGMVLRLPCKDGSFPGGAVPAPAPAATVPSTAAPAPVTVTNATDATVSFVTANGYLPYTDESLTNAGLISHLVSQAMIRGNEEQGIEIIFVNDRAAHLETLLPRQAFDASFPWTRPGCETQGELISVEFYSCQNYLYSDALYEIVEGYFAKKGSGYEAVLDYAGFDGATICRPEGLATGHLEENGLMPPKVTLLQPPTTHECFVLLGAGAVDVVALDTRAAERVLSDVGMRTSVSENPHLYVIQPLQVAVHKDNPRGEALIADLNRGIRDMLETGEWAAIVSDALHEQAEALMN